MKKIFKLSIFIILNCLSSYAANQDLYEIKTKSGKPIGEDFDEQILVKFKKTELKYEPKDCRQLIKNKLFRRNHQKTKELTDLLISSKIKKTNDVWKQTLSLENLNLLPIDLYKDGYNNFKTEVDDDGDTIFIVEIDPRYNLIFASMFYENSLPKLIANLRSLIQEVRDGNKITGLSLITIDVTREYLLNYIDKILPPEWKVSDDGFTDFRKSIESLKFGKSEILAMSDENLDKLIDANKNKVIQSWRFHYTYEDDSYEHLFYTKSSFYQELKAKILTFDSCSSREIRIINIAWKTMDREERDLVSEKLGVAIGPEGDKKYFVPWGEPETLSISPSDFTALKSNKKFHHIALPVKTLKLRYSMLEIDEDLIRTWLSEDLPNLQRIQIAIDSRKGDDFITINPKENNCTITFADGIIPGFDLGIITLINSIKTIKEIHINNSRYFERIAQITNHLTDVKTLVISEEYPDRSKVININNDTIIALINFKFPNLECLAFRKLKLQEKHDQCHINISEEQLKKLITLEISNPRNTLTSVEINGRVRITTVGYQKRLLIHPITYFGVDNGVQK